MDRELDPDICACIIEFLVRESVDQMLVSKLLREFPPLNLNPTLKKAMHLRSILNEIKAGQVSERILDSLEKIERIENNQKAPIPDSMKEAYCAVATDCTAVYLAGNSNSRGPYSDAFKRIWRGRIRDLENSNASNLVTEELKTRGNDLEAALVDDEMARNMVRNNTRNYAIIKLKIYLGEATASLGLPVLESYSYLLENNADKVDVKDIRKGIGALTF